MVVSRGSQGGKEDNGTNWSPTKPGANRASPSPHKARSLWEPGKPKRFPYGPQPSISRIKSLLQFSQTDHSAVERDPVLPVTLARHLTPLSLSFLIYSVGMVILILIGLWKGQNKSITETIIIANTGKAPTTCRSMCRVVYILSYLILTTIYKVATLTIPMIWRQKLRLRAVK